MKFIACFLVFGFIVAVTADGLSEEQKTKLRQVSKECQKKSGISDESIAKLRQGEYVKDSKTDAQILCFVQKTGVLNEAGQVQTDVLKTRLSHVVTDTEKLNTIVADCAVQKDTPTETAKGILKCLKDAKEASGKDISLI